MIHANRSLSDDAFVMLDPSVEILDAEVHGRGLLSHDHFGFEMAVPPGEGLIDFLGALRRGFDDGRLIDQTLSSLRRYGFAHETSQNAPSHDDLAPSNRRSGAWA